jgi:hypothetical protein
MKILLKEDEYFNHPYNNTITCERCIEVALAKRFIQEFPSCMEIGAVSPYYFDIEHTVIDPFDPYEKSIRKNAEDLDFNQAEVLSISTIEHIGDTQGYGNMFSAKSPQAAIHFLQKLELEAKRYFVSLPVGQHPPLTDYIKTSQINWFGYFKVSQKPEWVFTANSPKILEFNYAHPFPAANAVIFLTKNINLELW